MSCLKSITSDIYFIKVLYKIVSKSLSLQAQSILLSYRNALKRNIKKMYFHDVSRLNINQPARDSPATTHQHWKITKNWAPGSSWVLLGAFSYGVQLLNLIVCFDRMAWVIFSYTFGSNKLPLKRARLTAVYSLRSCVLMFSIYIWNKYISLHSYIRDQDILIPWKLNS